MSRRSDYFRSGPRRTPEQKRVGRAIKKLTKYMVTYPRQSGYLDYTDETIINDVLYGLGIALDDKYRFANGFEEFKNVLREHLTK
jgi:hypothetical protein